MSSIESRPITKLLVANRGEIARRIMRTATSMGIATVAVYAEADRLAPFVSEAAEAVSLDGRSASATYLDVAKILAAAERTGADAVHPGYGFLSENADFARAVIDAGLVWVGPPPAAIAAMGDKLAAKKLMAEAGVPTLESIEVEGNEDLVAAATSIGFPVLVKASAGGGGKGMRVVDHADALSEAVAGAKREAASAFGDDTVFIERYLTGTRHVEIQIMGDKHGNVVHLFERECSIQRRHQKIVEEAPSSVVDTDLRTRMGLAAVTAAEAIGYDNAGTVEFLLADDGSFFFLEVNTRLQVEHPVTEAITGRDLVRDQIRVARGEPLGFAQDDLTIDGHAIEVRIYAEDPAADFLPATGTLAAWAMPAEPRVRVDSGVETGSEVGIDFDPMLAKIVAHAPTRAEAAGTLALALERARIHGVTTNRDFLVATLRHPEFLAGATTTDFIDRAQPARVREPSAREVEAAAVAASLAAQEHRRRTADTLTTFGSGWRNSVMPPQRTVFVHGDDEVEVAYQPRRSGGFDVVVVTDSETGIRPGELRSESLARHRHVATVLGSDDATIDLELDGLRLHFTVTANGRRVYVHGNSGEVVLDEQPRYGEVAAAVVAGGQTAPMPGKVISVHCSVGDPVTEGQLLVVLEAMKMEHRIVAPFNGVVTEVPVAADGQVGTGDMLVVIEEAETA